MIDLRKARGILDRDFITEMEWQQRELEALREVQRVAMVHNHGKGTLPGQTHYPCSICEQNDVVLRVQRHVA